MSAVPQNLVYEGFWVDWSEGRVLGATITTSSNAANVLVAFLAILVATTGSRLWNILVFTFYQVRATEQAQDALFHQQQTLLRNVSSPTSIMMDFSTLAWHWRGKTRGSLRRSLFAIIPAFFCAIGFLIAGIFSSNVIRSSGINILVQSPNCGFMQYGNTQQGVMAAQQYIASTFETTLRYANLCYGNESSPATLCDVYSRQQIPITTEHVSCPFADSICLAKNPERAAMAMDTGLIDMNDWFSLNTPSEYHVQIRKRSTCAPIKLDNHIRIVNVSDTNREKQNSLPELPGDQEVQFYYGRPAGLNTNLTIGTTTYASNTTYTYTSSYQNSYSVQGEYYGGTFKPIPELYRKDADTIMITIFGNIVNYLAPVDDIVFSAHKPIYIIDSYGGNDTFFISDNPAGIITCTEQYQFCNPNTHGESSCTDLTGAYSAKAQAKNLRLNPKQDATLKLLTENIQLFEADMTAIGTTQPPPLKLSKYQQAYGGIPSVPNDQWEIEVVGFMEYVLSILQKLVSDHAIGLGRPEWDQYLGPISGPAERYICGEQKMKAPDGFSNISVFGLSITVAICGLIILADLVGVSLVKSLAKRGKINLTGMRYWNHDGTLQLQRKVYEGLGETEWAGADLEIPITLADKHITDLGTAFDKEKRTHNDTRSQTGSSEDINVEAMSDTLRSSSTGGTEEQPSNSQTHLADAGEEAVPSPSQSRTSSFPTPPPPERGIARRFTHHSELSQDPHSSHV